MKRPVNTTVKALRNVKEEKGLNYRELAHYLGYDDGFIGTLSAVANKKYGCISLERENELRTKLGLAEITESGRLRKSEYRFRPTASPEQNYRKNLLGVSWKEIIESGLLFLENTFSKEKE